MFLDAAELSEILEVEEQYLSDLKMRWGTDTLDPQAERHLRLGKRTELLGNLQASKERVITRSDTESQG